MKEYLLVTFEIRSFLRLGTNSSYEKNICQWWLNPVSVLDLYFGGKGRWSEILRYQILLNLHPKYLEFYKSQGASPIGLGMLRHGSKIWIPLSLARLENNTF